METALTSRHRATSRERWAWYLYDFGNSAYAAVVLLAVYSAYFKGTVVGGERGTWLWGLALGIAMLVVAVISPILGAIADHSGTKKRFLFFFTSMACLATALLFFVQKGDIWSGMLFFILAEIGYRSAQVFYDALLPEIAEENEIGRVSGNGWAIGSAGGIVCLILVLALIMLIGGSLTVRLSLVITALFFALAAAPLFAWLRERTVAQPLAPGETYPGLAYRRIKQTFVEIKHYRELFKFLIAFLVYNDGILMTMNFASIMGAVLYGLNQQQLILFMILVQVTSVVGAYVFGLVVDRMGGKPSLMICLGLMVAAVLWMFFNQSTSVFFVIGGLAGFALTGVQSVSRSMIGMLAPVEKSAEFYGFFAVAGRTSSFIGPTIYGWLASRIARWYEVQGQTAEMAEKLGLRLALFSIIAFLIVGAILLGFVKRSRRIASQN
ncbi:MAG: MFS transporter [Anaerolineae bacterium]|nr:MFS transporter [Anaerolineae bacterium]